jgi:hypothetical protein
VLQYANYPKIDPPSSFTHICIVPVSVIIIALDPNQIPTTAFAGGVGTTGAMKFLPTTMPLLMTKGLYMEIAPVAGSRMAALMNDP